jgi:hypothetical protein
MSNQSWQETLAVQQAAATLFNTFTTAKSVINPQAKLRIVIRGAISNIVTTPWDDQLPDQDRLGRRLRLGRASSSTRRRTRRSRSC